MAMKRIFLSLVTAGLAFTQSEAAAQTIRLIAHRGGVVDETHIEHSAAGIEAAIRRGYWMLEVDLRRTADGHIVVHHDPTFHRYYGDPRKVAELPWSAIALLRSTPGGLRPLKFREFAALCKSRIRLMLDIKGPSFPPEFYQEIGQVLREHGLLQTAYVLSNNEAKAFFRGKAMLAADRNSLRTALTQGEDVARHYFLFELADSLDEETIRWAEGLGVPVVAAVNTFRYEMRGRDHLRAAKEDIARLRRLGVTIYQIDSIYDQWLLPK
jgi:glycerophosphoryl diester phosphodiesterase